MDFDMSVFYRSRQLHVSIRDFGVLLLRGEGVLMGKGGAYGSLLYDTHLTTNQCFFQNVGLFDFSLCLWQTNKAMWQKDTTTTELNSNDYWHQELLNHVVTCLNKHQLTRVGGCCSGTSVWLFNCQNSWYFAYKF